MFRAVYRTKTYFRLLKYDSFKNVQKCLFCSELNPNSFKEKVSKGPKLSSFLTPNNNNCSIDLEYPPYISRECEKKISQKVYIETYGCQMNVSDTEIIYAILSKDGYEISKDIDNTDVILIMTCAIREGAEQKIWNRLKHLKSLKLKRKKHPLKIGILGCMAERLKRKLLEEDKMVDIVAGPDSYKDLPNLLSQADEGQKAINVMLSVDETYADIMPVRIDPASKSAFVSIMRGCDNLCSYCIVPVTRGKERSRPVSSILDEIRHLSDQGVKEITLLGQNVNSYRDLSVPVYSKSNLSSGFKTAYKNRIGGLRFADLLDKVSDINPEVRIRFTSPHPKDFPDEVLHVINAKPNICKLIHLPAQSGNTAVLENMKRGYSREAYLELVDHIRNIIPDIAFTSDFICGFCGETEQAHNDTLSLVEHVKYEFVYVFPYSMRQRTIASHDFKDDVPEDVKKQRAEEVHSIFRKCVLELHKKEIGKVHLVQVLGPSKRSELDWSGRNDWNTKVIYPQTAIPLEKYSDAKQLPSPGDYIAVQITDCSSQVLKGVPLYHTTLQSYYNENKDINVLCN